MRVWELRQLSETELKERLNELREKLFKQAFEAYDEETKNPGQRRNLKRQIAQIETVMRERQLGLERPKEDPRRRKS
ncbi:MAG: 50S ribosomal protein L29 [Planctomycetota bacterium]|nr:50S ribosomal protein L29 [Planctomycetota bacterium]